MGQGMRSPMLSPSDSCLHNPIAETCTEEKENKEAAMQSTCSFDRGVHSGKPKYCSDRTDSERIEF